MSCPAPDRVLDYLARRLDSSERDAIDAHVDQCAICRGLLADLVRTDLDDVVALRSVEEPTTIGRYRVEARVGEGGMGTVYAAFDPQLDRRVAVKLMHSELGVRGGVDRLLREGRALARLSHPNIVAVHDAGTDGSLVYVAMELVEGHTLGSWLASAPRTWRAIVEVFVAAGRGVAAAHRAGIVHRDLKPENVLIGPSGVPKVADFGLAGHWDVPGAPMLPRRLTEPGAIVGTPLYMSPEQRRGGEVGPATDQYSLCAALSTALADHGIPRWLRRAIDRGLALEPANRFASVEDLIAAIDPQRRRLRNRRIAFVVAVSSVLVVGGVAYRATHEVDSLALACSAATSADDQLWTSRDQVAVSSALVATRAPFAADVVPRFAAAVEHHRTSLATVRNATCGQRPITAAGRETFDDAIACLTERRQELANLIVQFHQPTTNDVRIGVARVHGLSPIDDCSNPSLLAAERVARANPALRVIRLQIRSDLRAARAANADGKFREAVGLARRAVALSRTFGGLLLVKALLVEAELAVPVDGFPAIEAALREAATAAEAVHADGLRALAFAYLMSAMAREPGREKEALAFRPLVEAAIARGGKQQALTPVLQQATGTAQLRLGDSEAAIVSFSAALEAARNALPPGDSRLPNYIYPVGLALGMARREAEAASYHAEAYKVASEIWGPNHPNAVRFEINLATKHGALHDCTAALREASHARAALRDVLPPHSPEHLLITETIGTCYYEMRDYDAALREHRSRQVALRAAGLTKTVDMATSWTDIGDVQLALAQFEDAVTSHRRAIAELEGIVGTTHPRLAYYLARLGEAELAAHSPAVAITTLERAVALAEASNIAPLVAADALYPLARALWSRPADRARAKELATAARAAYATGGAPYADRLDAVDVWLRDHR